MKVLSVVGSPRKDGNTAQVVEHLSNNLEGVDQELIYLSDYELGPCLGCMRCVHTNRCVQEDGWDHIQSCLMEADVLILGFPTYYAFSLGFNAMTHVFLERWFALRHLGVKLKLKKIICVVSSGTSPEVAQKGLTDFFVNYHRLPAPEFLNVQTPIACMTCGVGDVCEMSGLALMAQDGIIYTPDMKPDLSKQPEVFEKAAQIAASISALKD